MHKITATQLSTQLSQGLASTYFIVGADPFLQQESINAIWESAGKHQFDDQFRFDIDAHTDWENIYDCCRALSLFSSKTRLLLRFSESGITAPLTQHLNQLAELAHQELLIVLVVPKLTKAQENSQWYKTLSPFAVYVQCSAPEHAAFSRWIAERAQHLTLHIDDASLQSLAYYYEGNLLALSQTLAMLQLLYPDGKITLPRLEHVLQDAAQFTVYHWIDALLKGNLERATHILHQLKANETEPLIMLRVLQKELLQLIQLTRASQTQPLKTSFDQLKIWQNKRAFITQAMQRLSLPQLRMAIHSLSQIEISLKQDYSSRIWEELVHLGALICLGKRPLSFPAL